MHSWLWSEPRREKCQFYGSKWYDQEFKLTVWVLTLLLLTGPSQEALMYTVLQAREGNRPIVPCVETHGTGTALGDPIEIGALSHVFRGCQLLLELGASKTNIGHAETAAGIMQVIKSILSGTVHAVLPALHLQMTNPKLDLEDFEVLLGSQSAPSNCQETHCTGVSSFGATGQPRRCAFCFNASDLW